MILYTNRIGICLAKHMDLPQVGEVSIESQNWLLVRLLCAGAFLFQGRSS